MFHFLITHHLLCLGHQIPLGCRIWCQVAWSFWKWNGAVFYQCTDTSWVR